jgi:hypothetical protein
MIGLQCLGDVSGKNPLPSAAQVRAVAGIEQPSTLSIRQRQEGSFEAGTATHSPEPVFDQILSKLLS